jgi:uncharacterized protein (DUF2237 family)
MTDAKNVFGETLYVCCTSPITGFYRTGTCETGPQDAGTHVICAQVTEEFLMFSRSRGNDLITPAPEHGFPGLKPGDCWCPVRHPLAGGPGGRGGPTLNPGGNPRGRP